MEVFGDEKIEEIDRQIAELQRAVSRFDDERERTLTLQPAQTEKPVRPKINYGLKERKYNYEHIEKVERLDAPSKVVVAPRIDKNWLAANMEAPDVGDFFDEKELFRPSGSVAREFADVQGGLDTRFARTVADIVKRDDLAALNSLDFDYAHAYE